MYKSFSASQLSSFHSLVRSGRQKEKSLCCVVLCTFRVTFSVGERVAFVRHNGTAHSEMDY